MKKKLQIIDWDDHWSFIRDSWRGIEEMEAQPDSVRCSSIGYVIKETKRSVTISGTVCYGDEGALSSTRGEQIVLKRCIVRRRNLVEQASRRK